MGELEGPRPHVLLVEVGLADQGLFALPISAVQDVLGQREKLPVLQTVGERVRLAPGRDRGLRVDRDDSLDEPHRGLVAVGDLRIAAHFK